MQFVGGSEAGHTLQVTPTLTPGACDITVAEWNGSNFLPMWCADQFGCQALAMTSRWEDTTLPYDRLPYWHYEKLDILLGSAKTLHECTTLGFSCIIYMSALQF